MFHFFLILKSLNRFSFHRNHLFLAEHIIKNNRLSFVIYRRPSCVSTGDIRLYNYLKKPFVNKQNGSVYSAFRQNKGFHYCYQLCRIFCKCKEWGHVPTVSKGTCAMIDDEILSKVTSIEEDEEDCGDTDEIEDLIQPPTKYEVMQAWRF